MIPHLTSAEKNLFQKINTPARIQDYLNLIPINFEKNGETLYSPRNVLRNKKAHCMEGALFAAAALWYHGHKPLLMDLETADSDENHVVTLFRERSGWGAISKTNHAVLRYREPIYRNLRELAMSYFHEYFLDSGQKTMTGYSSPFDLSARKYNGWVTAKSDLWQINRDLDDSEYFNIASETDLKKMRLADEIERKAGKIVEWKKD